MAPQYENLKTGNYWLDVIAADEYWKERLQKNLEILHSRQSKSPRTLEVADAQQDCC
jgi:hypothetical protein